MKKALGIIFLILVSYFSYGQLWKQMPYQPVGSDIVFPKDDGAHLGLDVQTEWWYTNIHVIGSAPDYKEYDVMLCYFSRPAQMRIFNISEAKSKTFEEDVVVTPPLFTQGENDWDLSYNVPFSTVDDVSYSTYALDSVPYSYVFKATAPDKGSALDIKMVSNKQPLIVGGTGWVGLGDQGDSSYYFSYTNMSVTGAIQYEGNWDTITSGIGWIDRQWGPFTVGINKNNLYEWFSLQVDKPGAVLGDPQHSSEFNVWQIYKPGANEVPFQPNFRTVSAQYFDGSQEAIVDFIFERKGYWHDSEKDVYYSLGWRLIEPNRGICIEMDPYINDQVVDVVLFDFWEGGTLLKGTVNNEPVEGKGFAELVAAHEQEIVCPKPPTNLTVDSVNNQYALSWDIATAGTYPVGGYRIYRSTTLNGYWQYVGSTTGQSFVDTSITSDSLVYYGISTFDNQTATSASRIVEPGYTSIDENFGNVSLKIFPNPANDVLNIFSGVVFNEINVVNILGEVVLQQNINKRNFQISVNGWTPGVYVLGLQNSQLKKTVSFIVD